MQYSNTNPPPQLATPRQNLLNQCCCCCDLRQGVLILAALEVLNGIFGVIPTGGINAFGAANIVLSVFRIVFGIVGFLGAYNYNPKFVKVYFVFTALIIVASVIIAIVASVALRDLAEDACREADIADSDIDACANSFVVSFWTAFIIPLLFELYFLAVIYSFLKQLEDTFAQIETGQLPRDGPPMNFAYNNNGAPVVVVQNGQAYNPNPYATPMQQQQLQPQQIMQQQQPQTAYVANPIPKESPPDFDSVATPHEAPSNSNADDGFDTSKK